jgi:hypothetical protein
MAQIEPPKVHHISKISNIQIGPLKQKKTLTLTVDYQKRDQNCIAKRREKFFEKLLFPNKKGKIYSMFTFIAKTF